MKWRTDKPIEEVIVAQLNADFCGGEERYALLYIATKPYEHYHEDGEEIPYGAIVRWASLEDEEPKCLYNRTLEERQHFCKYCSAACQARLYEFYKEPVREPVSNTIDFEQELYKAFGQVKDFTLCMRIAKWFYEMGRNHQEPASESNAKRV